MSSELSNNKPLSLSRRNFLLVPLALYASHLLAAESATTPTPLPAGACPLNSGGPSLLGSRWRLVSVYNNKVPDPLRMTMTVGENNMSGRGGCNDYNANFLRVGNRGFKVVKIQKAEAPCEVMSQGEGQPTIDTGSWEGNYLRVLRRAGSVQQEGTLLQFYDFNGTPSLVFAKVYGSRVPTPSA